MANEKERRRRRNGLILIFVLLLVLALAALAIALVSLFKGGSSIEEINRELIIQNETITTLENRVSPSAINGWVAFWWEEQYTGLKHSWARFNITTGKMIDLPVPYSPSEARQSSPPGKSQFSRGPEPNDLVFLMYADVSLERYLVRHNTETKTYLKTDLGANPANHNSPQIMDYDPTNERYIALAPITSASNKFGVVLLDETTGVITPLTGAGGTLPPAPVNTVLDMEVIGDRILMFDRWDDSTSKGHIFFYNSSDGQYLSESFFNGTFIPYAGTFIPTFLTVASARLWYIAGSYDASTFRMHFIVGNTGLYDRAFAWAQGESEADLLEKLESGNYDLYFSQNLSPFQFNAGVFIA